MKNETKLQQGFTIMETIIVIAVFSIILLGLLSLYDNFNKIYYAQQATTRVVGAATQTGNELQADTRQASQIVPSHTISGTLYNTDSDTLIIRLPSIDSSGNIITNEYDYIVFYIAGSGLYKRVAPSGTSNRPALYKQLSDTVSTASFVYNNSDLLLASRVDVDILMQLTANRQIVTQRLRQTLFLHNL